LENPSRNPCSRDRITRRSAVNGRLRGGLGFGWIHGPRRAAGHGIIAQQSTGDARPRTPVATAGLCFGNTPATNEVRPSSAWPAARSGGGGGGGAKPEPGGHHRCRRSGGEKSKPPVRRGLAAPARPRSASASEEDARSGADRTGPDDGEPHACVLLWRAAFARARALGVSIRPLRIATGSSANRPAAVVGLVWPPRPDLSSDPRS
jgi:hypothetical protein